MFTLLVSGMKCPNKTVYCSRGIYTRRGFFEIRVRSLCDKPYNQSGKKVENVTSSKIEGSGIEELRKPKGIKYGNTFDTEARGTREP